jgi:rhamnulokinase
MGRLFLADHRTRKPRYIEQIEMSASHYLAVDLGAESGRGVLGEFDGKRVSLREIGRFATGRGDEDSCPDGVQRWDIDRIFAATRDLIPIAKDLAGGEIGGIGVDSWGVDFGLFDGAGALLARPVCYRDRSHLAARDAVLERITDGELWDETGIQGMAFNTIYQIEAMLRREPSLLERAKRLLLIPDLLHNLLMGGGHDAVEATDASTTQMMHPGAGDWNFGLLERLGLPSHFLGPTIGAGSRIGSTRAGIPIYASATHDTASAVVAAPYAASDAAGADWAFLSSGTWSLIGAEIGAPVMSRNAMRLKFSNEGGVGGSIRFLKNIVGLWLVQQSRRSIQIESGREYTYAELVALAEQAPPGPLIDAVGDRFLNPRDMVEEIQTACAESGQSKPGTPGEIVRCCLESLALSYRRSLRDLVHLLGRPISVLHIVGGGSQNALLNQLAADACGIPVLAGPSEATALGNVLGQMVGAGAIKDWREARVVSCRSFTPARYLPRPTEHDRWSEREYKAVQMWDRSPS